MYSMNLNSIRYSVQVNTVFDMYCVLSVRSVQTHILNTVLDMYLKCIYMYYIMFSKYFQIQIEY
jgi:hypothetical protein